MYFNPMYVFIYMKPLAHRVLCFAVVTHGTKAAPESSPVARPCHFFARGHCRNGSACKFAHVACPPAFQFGPRTSDTKAAPDPHNWGHRSASPPITSDSASDYLADRLSPSDATNYMAAGILLCHVRGYHPVAAATQPFDFLTLLVAKKNELSFLGGTKKAGEDVYITAARNFDQESDSLLGISHSLLAKICQDSPVFWYSRGNYALFLVDSRKLPGAQHRLPSAESFRGPQHKAELTWLDWEKTGVEKQKLVMHQVHETQRKIVADVFACGSFKSWLVERIRAVHSRRTDPTATEHAQRYDQHGQPIMGRRLEIREFPRQLSENFERRAERAEFSVSA